MHQDPLLQEFKVEDLITEEYSDIQSDLEVVPLVFNQFFDSGCTYLTEFQLERNSNEVENIQSNQIDTIIEGKD